MLKAWFDIVLWKRVLVALVLGIGFGLLIPDAIPYISWVGEVFVRLIRMVIVPLIFLTLVSGVIAMGDPKKLGSIGGKTLLMYTGTTAIAITIGLTLAAIIEPGVGVSIAGAEPKDLPPPTPLSEQLLKIIPRNPVEAFANGEVLGIIFFSLMLGIGIMLAGDKGKPVAKLFDSGAEVIIKVTGVVMELAPFGVFALISNVAASQGLAGIFTVVPLAVAFILACVIHILVVHGAIMTFLLKLPPIRFFRGVLDAQLVAFSTSSSSAPLPVTMRVAENNLGVRQSVASSVLPLGSTINMDGTAIYVGIVAVFSAQLLGIDLGLVDYLLIALTTTLVSVGSAGIPSASLFLLGAVLSILNVSADQTALIVGFLFAFDRPLDMMRTVVNVTGDLSVSTVVAKWEGELDEDTFKHEAVE